MSHLPDFLVIGAMKSATTTLHEQLARQPGLFMSRPKEPNFFSDDAVFAKGLGWYTSIFQRAEEKHLRGESSTHYTKLPTYPKTVERMVKALPRVKLIYLMRHPIDRLRSHYFHEMTVGRIKVGLEEAIDRYPELVDYGRYSMQLEPFVRAYGAENIHPVFFDRLVSQPDQSLEQIGRFLGTPEPLRWDHSLKAQNVGRERLRDSPWRNALVQAPVLSTLRRTLIPKPLAEHVKSYWTVGIDPLNVPPDLETRLRVLFDPDLVRLGSWLGISLDCNSFRSTTGRGPQRWSEEFHAKTQRGGQECQEDRSNFSEAVADS
jgi:hypothetical protein